ncbi:MAG: PD-(D/E)XK nuclease family protein [Candidatus Omnitrophota bacterium]
MPHFSFSPTSLNLFLDCPRCFWLHFNREIRRPRGAFPSLPGGMDRVIKEYYDIYRKKQQLPPELEGKVEGLLFEDTAVLEDWRNWRKGLSLEDGRLDVTLKGALDDCLIRDGLHHPLDYKTKGSAPTLEDARRYYQNQLDCYALLLESNKRPAGSFGYLVYYYPGKVGEKGIVQFQVEPFRLEIDPFRAKERMKEAVTLLKSPEPKSVHCEYCEYTGSFE